MRPVNSKSLMHFLFDQMDKLDKGVIDEKRASQIANLAKQASRVMAYELKRVEVKMKIATHNSTYGGDIQLRELDAKSFDDTTKQ